MPLTLPTVRHAAYGSVQRLKVYRETEEEVGSWHMWREPTGYGSIWRAYAFWCTALIVYQEGSRRSHIPRRSPYHIYKHITPRSYNIVSYLLSAPAILDCRKAKEPLFNLPSAYAVPSSPFLVHIPSTATISSQIRYQLSTAGAPLMSTVATQVQSSISRTVSPSILQEIASGLRSNHQGLRKE